jgi:hypothetical protein
VTTSSLTSEIKALRWSAAYFRSGWAFLIPYLATYLLYAWLKWPLNPAAGEPCLLHVYWLLHGLHLVLAAMALRDWLRHTSHLHSRSSLLRKTAPWVCLMLLFYIPGVYMEYPSDPWQHFARVNEWRSLESVTEHSVWGKFSYFLAYSFIGVIAPPLLQLKWFDLYYTVCCLLLCWQYYRLARATGLNKQASFLFVLLQALLSGNDSFGFYRYYGMSSTVFAQLGAVALIRLVLETLAPSAGHTNEAHKFAAGAAMRVVWPELRQSVRRAAKPLVAGLLLLSLTACNHMQGVIIAGVGVVAVITWKLIEWRRGMVMWLGGAAILLSLATVLWYHKNPLLESRYGPEGWFSPWQGFNLFSTASPAHERSIQIVGVFGLIDLLAGLWMISRNHVAGWLTVMPVLLLSLPVFAIPVASKLAGSSEIPGGYIFVFHRVLFAIPVGLALVTAFAMQSAGVMAGSASVGRPPADRRQSLAPLSLLLLTLAALVLVPANNGYFNRTYHTLMVPPRDLAMHQALAAASAHYIPTELKEASPVELTAQRLFERGGVLTTPGIGYVLNATGAANIAEARKRMMWPTPSPPSLMLSTALARLSHVNSDGLHQPPLWPTAHLYSAYSFLGQLSRHWLPAEVALEHAGQQELFAREQASTAQRRRPMIRLEWMRQKDGKQFYAKLTGAPADTFAPEDWQLESPDASPQNNITQGEHLVLRPILRTLDGNGGIVAATVIGPGHSDRFVTSGSPNPLGGESWVIGNHSIQLDQPGDYTVMVQATVFWPIETYEAVFNFRVRGR